jgi:predicted GNAT family acetyltransferase
MVYEKQIMHMACDNINKNARTPALAVSSANKAACSLYENMGFETIGTTIVYMQERDFKGDENE